jgi:c-di-GMP-binding flagellar brake protein YcgR
MPAGETNLELLRAAIARKAGIVLSLPARAAEENAGDGAGEDAPLVPLKHYKSRFLADGGDGLWVTSVPAEPALLRDLVARRHPAGVSFRSGHAKVMFAAPVLHLQSDYPSADGAGFVDALLLRFPEPQEVRAAQRRRNYRVPVPPHADLKVRLWLMSEEAHLRDRPLAKSELRCDVYDLSVAGIGIVIHGANGKAPAVGAGDRVRIQLVAGATTVLLEGRLRYPPRPVEGGQGSVRAGIQFKTLGDGREDRQSLSHLDKVVSDLQREAIRRKKLGAA